MPRKKNFRRKRKTARRTFKRKGRGKRMTKRTKGIQKRPAGFADAQLMKFNYSHHLNNAEIALISVASRGFVYTFRGNSLWDPDYTSTGGQPLWYSIWSQVYFRYLVHACKINVSYIPLTSTASGQNFICVVPFNTPMLQSAVGQFTIEQLKSFPYSRWKFTTGAAGQGPTRIKHFISSNKVHGVRKIKMLTDPNYASQSNGNPPTAGLWYWNIFVIPTDEAATPVGSLSIKLTFYTEMFELLSKKQAVTGASAIQETHDVDQDAVTEPISYP